MHTLRCYVDLQLHRYLKSCQKDLQLNGCFLPKNVPLSLVCFLVLTTLINQKYPLYLPGNKLFKKIIKKVLENSGLARVRSSPDIHKSQQKKA